MNIEFEVHNLKCGGCSATIQDELLKLKGVESVLVDPDLSKVTISVQEESNQKDVINCLKEIGYPVMDAKNSLESKVKSYISCMSGKLKSRS